MRFGSVRSAHPVSAAAVLGGLRGGRVRSGGRAGGDRLRRERGLPCRLARRVAGARADNAQLLRLGTGAAGARVRHPAPRAARRRCACAVRLYVRRTRSHKQ